MARELPKPKPTHEEIAQRAYDIFVERGRPEGRDLEHWLEAEAQLKRQPHIPAVARSTGGTIQPQARRSF